MKRATRRTFLGGTVGAATLLAGCPFNDSSGSSGSFTNTTISEQQLIVEFEESLEAETISVIDPDGEGFAETSVTTGATRVTFEILMPYTPGEYRIVAAADGETIAETTQQIQPELEIVDVGVGANRMDEMPEELHFPERQIIVKIKNKGTGPGAINRIEYSDEFPNDNSGSEGSGIFNRESGIAGANHTVVSSGSVKSIFSSNLPFANYESFCDEAPKRIESELNLRLMNKNSTLDKDVDIVYSDPSPNTTCKVHLEVASSG